MIANALIVTVALLLALGFWLMGELKFLNWAMSFLMSKIKNTSAAGSNVTAIT